MKRAVLLTLIALLLLPALASAASVCPTPPRAGTTVDLAAILGPLPTAQPEVSLPAGPAAIPMTGCDKDWCSMQRAGCRSDCLPCSFSFTCFVVQCSYSCQCLC
ncbi:MAG TPA: hypothetical protein VMM92_11470 [Thermoanaerobaculia bacterium]|nr:hypothetical protein [Thermoanaerobaculia bacterium]